MQSPRPANEPIYTQHGLRFEGIATLEALGLLRFESLTGYVREELPPKFRVSYAEFVMDIELKPGTNKLNMGKVMPTDAGWRLAPLTNATQVPDFVEYVLGKWRADGHKADVIKPAAPTAPPPAEPSAAV